MLGRIARVVAAEAVGCCFVRSDSVVSVVVLGSKDSAALVVGSRVEIAVEDDAVEVKAVAECAEG
jgi:hypothetical protein